MFKIRKINKLWKMWYNPIKILFKKMNINKEIKPFSKHRKKLIL